MPSMPKAFAPVPRIYGPNSLKAKTEIVPISLNLKGLFLTNKRLVFDAGYLNSYDAHGHKGTHGSKSAKHSCHKKCCVVGRESRNL